MVHGTVDGFSKMQMKAQRMPPVLINSINLPWRTHPGMPRAIQDMKENLTSRLPEWPVSKIEELNTLLLTDASSMEEYEDLYTLNEHVVRCNQMRPARSLEEFNATDKFDRAMLRRLIGGNGGLGLVGAMGCVMICLSEENDGLGKLVRGGRDGLKLVEGENELVEG
ncbi:hypothetical protein C5167_045896 [Papaver somniferum]|uniref:Uncharacterized protein n=1 Tax=Papaver somniferum TaxID=3469 RepID=A0A4Y7LEP6_PAPSO|nr:uncharacterized protein LOC113321513 [Papaver somniferum]RZC83110.1 hypothetical protein C5167_045896 [Papaver somniferum]